jgi:hypothetical protein
VWFFPLVMVALLAAHPERLEPVARDWTSLEPHEADPIPIHIAAG